MSSVKLMPEMLHKFLTGCALQCSHTHICKKT